MKEKGGIGMDRIRSLDRFQKIILTALVVMAVVFAGIYGITASRVGFAYRDTILVPRQVDGATLYEGRLGDSDCTFTVTADTVTLVCGKTYGPYTLREDPTAVPADDPMAPQMTGIEILEGSRRFFRGSVMPFADSFMLCDADGAPFFTATVTMSDGTQVDMNGSTVNPYKPTPHTIVELLHGPELTHKGYWPVLVMGIFVSLVMAVDILFCDELFRFRLSFRVQDTCNAEPSDWELMRRKIGWSLCPIIIFFLYLYGLQ